MKMNINKKIKKNLDLFARATGLKIQIQSYWILVSIDKSYDASIKISIGNKEYPFWINYRDSDRLDLREWSSDVIAMGEFSSQDMKTLRAKNIPFISDKQEFYLPITLRSDSKTKSLKSTELKATEDLKLKVNRGFTSSARMASFIHYLISATDGLTKKQKTISEELGMSVGSVNKFLQELEAGNFIVNSKPKIKIVDKRRLLELWVSEYTKKIRPGLNSTYFEVPNESLKRELRTKTMRLKNGYWSGTKGADVILESEIPSKITLYSDDPKELVKELRLRPSENGDIEIREKFWKFAWPEQDRGIVDLPLIYADLKTSRDPRDGKIAEEIVQEWLKSKR